MKPTIRRILNTIITCLLFAVIFTWVSAAYAQDTNAIPISPEAASAAANIAGGLLAALTAKYGWIVAVISWIGVLRAAVKPIMLVVEAVVAATPGTADDAALAKFESGPIYKWLVWGLDWITSIKLTPAASTNPLTK